MKKDMMKKCFKTSTGLRGAVLALMLSVSVFATRPALADCEVSSNASAALAAEPPYDINLLNLLIIQEASFMSNIMQTAFAQLATYDLQFGQNIEKTLTEWVTAWSPDVVTALKNMTAELHVAQVDQTFNLGQILDAQLMAEEATRNETHLTEGRLRYQPSQMACDIDSVGPGLSVSYQISRAINRSLALDDAPRHENAINTESATGPDLSTRWLEYVKNFCDPTMGDQGCLVAGTLPGRHKDIPAILWGHQQTIDISNPDNLLAIQASLRYFVDPIASDPISKSASASALGHKALLGRHAELAFTNTIYNTLGAMLSERTGANPAGPGGSMVNVQLMRTTAGVPASDASTNASYREIQEAITRDRFNNPDYLVQLVSDPVQVQREQTTLNAIRLQVMNDTFRRNEERLFMESAEYGRELDAQMPSNATFKTPLK